MTWARSSGQVLANQPFYRKLSQPRSTCDDWRSAAPGTAQRPPEASEDPQQDKRGQLQQVPGGVELHIEQHQAAVPKRVDGAQSEGGDQSGEEGTPQGLQGEVITHLEERDRGGGREHIM